MTSTAISCCEGRILSLFEEIVGQAYTKMKGDLFCSFFFFWCRGNVIPSWWNRCCKPWQQLWQSVIRGVGVVVWWHSEVSLSNVYLYCCVFLLMALTTVWQAGVVECQCQVIACSKDPWRLTDIHWQMHRLLNTFCWLFKGHVCLINMRNRFKCSFICFSHL